MFKYYLRTIVVSWKIYGFGRVLFFSIFVEALLRGFTFFTLFLDNIFYRKYKNIKVEKPIFILGHPRSGTTFLHNILTSTDETAVFKTWHILFPALTARLFIKPLINRLIRKGKTVLVPESAGHKTDLNQVDEEELLFLNNYDTQFITIGLLGLDENEYSELHFQDKQPRSRRMKSMKFFNGCLQRHMLYTGKRRIIAQTHFSTMRIKTLAEYYPDAKFIFVVRSPHQTVPSFFSLLHKAIDYRWGLKKIPTEVLNRYNKKRYQAMIDLYRYFYDLDTNSELPPGRVLTLPYDKLLKDLVSGFEEICALTGLEPSKELRDKVRKQAAKQKDFKRKHKVMELEQFGITREMITRDFAFVFERYGIASEHKDS